MRTVIERLEVEGFKSFRDRTVIRFPRSVSVLVGSNGSGKSNVTDAVRWAFGERDLMSLRVSTPSGLRFVAEDGIDVTSDTRVTVTLIQTAGAGSGGSGMAAAGATAAGEVGATGVAGSGLTLTRVLDREGRESLLVDGLPVDSDALGRRLRELGVEAPLRTVIRQGEVGRLLWLAPEERADLFASATRDGHETHGVLRLQDLIEERAHLVARVAHHERREAELRQELAGLADAAVRAEGSLRLDEQIARLRRLLLSSLAQETGVDRHTSERVEGSDPTVVAADLRRLLARRRETGAVDTAALVRSEVVSAELARVREARAGTVAALSQVHDELQRGAEARASLFFDLHARVQARFCSFFQTLAPGGDAALPLTGGDAGCLEVGKLPGVDVRARFPKKTEVPLKALSGGQLVVVGLCLALAFFLEIPSPALILDEVEPALDEIMVRRVASLLALLAEERQVIMVSHQRMTRETARTVFQVDRTPALGSHIKLRYDPRELRAPGHRVAPAASE